MTEPFEGFDLEAAIVRRAEASGWRLAPETVEALATHARETLLANEHLHLTTITDGDGFVERHIGEALEGATIVGERIEGKLLDLGSGNGYPGLAMVTLCKGLIPCLSEASPAKAAFLDRLLEGRSGPGCTVARQVQRPTDLLPEHPSFQVIVTRAMGGWERILPRFASTLEPGGRVLLWAGAGAETTTSRAGWRERLRLVERRPLPGRDASWIWVFEAA